MMYLMKRILDKLEEQSGGDSEEPLKYGLVKQIIQEQFRWYMDGAK